MDITKTQKLKTDAEHQLVDYYIINIIMYKFAAWEKAEILVWFAIV